MIVGSRVFWIVEDLDARTRMWQAMRTTRSAPQSDAEVQAERDGFRVDVRLEGVIVAYGFQPQHVSIAQTPGGHAVERKIARSWYMLIALDDGTLIEKTATDGVRPCP